MNSFAVNLPSIHQGFLMLVNAQYPIQQKELEVNQVLVDPDFPKVRLESRVAVLLNRLVDAVEARGKILAVSGYRTQIRQAQIYGCAMRDRGAEFTRKFVAKPGCSEHQTGLAVDLSLKTEKVDELTPDFPYTGLSQKFRLRAAEFGFVERYPQGKEKITGIGHEPWHFRYVGFPHSVIMVQNQLTLEEYLTLLKSYPLGQKVLQFEASGRRIEIAYMAQSNLEILGANLPIHTPYQVSGNNQDGYIVTIWRRGR